MKDAKHLVNIVISFIHSSLHSLIHSVSQSFIHSQDTNNSVMLMKEIKKRIKYIKRFNSLRKENLNYNETFLVLFQISISTFISLNFLVSLLIKCNSRTSRFFFFIYKFILVNLFVRKVRRKKDYLYLCTSFY